LIFNVPVMKMQHLIAGVYVGDITGRDGFYTRQIATITLTIIDGITIQPVVVT